MHNSFARSSPFVDEGTRAATDADDVYHFVAYTALGGTLYELDGLQPAPIAHGACDKDSFAKAIIPVLQRRIARYPAQEIRFNLLAMIRDPRVRAAEIGDQETLQREEARRAAWLWENELRRHNFVGFTHEVLRAVVADKVKKGEFGEWVDGSWDKARKRVEERKKAGGAGGDDVDMDL